MALIIYNLPNSGASSADYPQGSVLDEQTPGLLNGTQVKAALYNDFSGFFQKLLDVASITPSGDADTILASDYMDGLNYLLDLIDEKYQPQNTEKLLLNDVTATPGDAYIGNGYQGDQYHGYAAIGNQFYGEEAEGVQYYGHLASGTQHYGYASTGTLYFGSSAEATQNYGENAEGDQYYGRGTAGDQLYGHLSTGAIAVGSTLGEHGTKKLRSGSKEATFEKIIDASDNVYTYTTATQSANWSGSTQYRKVMGENFLHIKGAPYRNASTSDTLFTLPAGDRPPSQVNKILMTSVPSNALARLTINTDGTVDIVCDELQTIYIDELIHLT